MAIETVLARAQALIASGAMAEALALLQATPPANARHAQLLGDLLHAAGRDPEAVAAYTTARGHDDRSPDAWFGAGCAYLALNETGSALACLRRAAALAPWSGAVQYNLGKALFELGRVEAAIAAFERAGEDKEVAATARATIACIIPGSPSADQAAIRHARQTWTKTAEPLQRPPRPPGAKHRIGYLSAFFGAANWMKPVFALINRHDRAAFEIYLLSDGEPPSAASGYRDHDADTICDLRGVGNEQAAGIIAATGIDILVDLNGYSFQSRLPLLHHRPAPHSVGWFNYFATSGMPGLDWLIGDDIVVRPEESRFYTERIHRLPSSYLAFEILYDVPDIAPPPCAAAGGITFGCLGSQYKLTDAVLNAWRTILLAAPAAHLFIKNAALDDASVQADLLARLGLAADRVTMQGRSPHYDFLNAYRHVDIALDTFPYNGGTTTTEALWQGVPVLTFAGDRWASRTSHSLLHAAGLDDWVLPNAGGYISRAIALANDSATPQHLASLRAAMRTRLKSSAACDASGLCTAMETFYRGLREHDHPGRNASRV